VSRLSVVADSSALIALDGIGLLDRFGPLFDSFLIPPAVARETAAAVQRLDWISIRPLSRPLDARVKLAGLDPGVTEVLGLALELATYTVIVGERRARRTALALGLPLIGVVGLLARAKRVGVLPHVRPSIEALQRSGFFVSDALIERVLREAGEFSE
jgi:predicted nucleic acid-binding protein